jgi:hypothetical protein
MRRLVPIALAALLTLGFVSPVAAGRPEVFPQEKITQLFENSCGFDVFLEDSFAAGKLLLFPPDDDGSQLLVSTGGFKSTLTNLENPENTIDVKFFGHLALRFLDDGNIALRQSGHALWWFEDPADAGMLGLDPGIYIITGRLEALTDGDFVTISPVDMSTVHVRDLCAELAA